MRPAVVVRPADYLDPADSLPLDYTLKPGREFDVIYKDYLAPGETTGDWAEPSLNDLVERMRWAVEHRSELRAVGKAAAKRIAKGWTWQGKTEGLVIRMGTTR
jgi:hypothetical protein